MKNFLRTIIILLIAAISLTAFIAPPIESGNILHSLMRLASQDGWGGSFGDTTFFMLVYGVHISYGPVIRWIIAGLMVAAVIAMIVYRRSGSPYRPFSQGEWDVSAKGIVISLIGTLLFFALFIGATLLLAMLAANIWPGSADNHVVITGTITMLILTPLAYFYQKALTSFAGWDALGLILAILLGTIGLVAAVLVPGLEYFLLICAGLIALRVAKPYSKLAYFFTGIAAGVLFLPLLYIVITQIGAAILSGAMFALFIPVLYVLAKDYPAGYY